MHNDRSNSSPLGISEPSDLASDGDPIESTKALSGDLTLTNDIPPPKRYAHHGKRRRSYTEELFRCQHSDKISKSDLVCNALLWKNRPKELRQHLLVHLSVEDVGRMTDDEILKSYTEARRIMLQGIPEDIDDNEDESESEEYEE